MSRKEIVAKIKPKPISHKLTKKEPDIEIPKDLKDQWSAVVAIATCYKLMQEGHFTYAHRNAVGVSLAFLEELHQNALMNVSKHERADLIPEIRKTVDDKAAQLEQTKDN